MRPFIFLAIVLGAVMYGFLNGYKDAAGITATVISSRALRPRYALILIGVAEFAGAFVFGTAVASTVGRDLIVTSVMTPDVVLAALGSAVIWNLIMTVLGLPASSTHALIGSLIGAAFASAGVNAILLPGVFRLLIVLLISPLIGFILSYLLLRLTLFLSQNATPRVNILFKRLQIISAVLLAMSHGSNDAQKSIGIIAMGLVASQYTSRFEIPLWVIVVGAGSLSLGACLGGNRVIRTVGGKLFRIRPVHGFAAQVASTLTVLAANLWGQPISTTWVASGAITGAGSSERVSKVRWITVGNIALAWLVTLPATAVLAGLLWMAFMRLLLF